MVQTNPLLGFGVGKNLKVVKFYQNHFKQIPPAIPLMDTHIFKKSGFE
jgi:hypothetical protein